jgi:hypothetical protein
MQFGKKLTKIHWGFCMKILRVHRFAANGIAELHLRGDRRRGEVLCVVMKYWLQL